MNRISILDCTLRDGGYINDFCFGEKTMKDVISKLAKASIDIIECGFLKENSVDKNRSLFGSIEAIKPVIGNKNPNCLYVAMIQYGAIPNDAIVSYDNTSIDGIRLTFHEQEIDDAFILGKQLMEKGYKVFMQPVGTTNYTDGALLSLISRINELRPFAFYLVDTLGVMYKNDLLRMFYLVDHNLDKSIAVGFHSHNNLQLSFANAQELIQINSPRHIIIDSSIYGMGRGAGNLNTELMTQYINSNFSLTYDNLEIFEILDQYIRPLSLNYKWGYEAAYYIASVVRCHPNYASFLMNKQTLHVQDIYAILSGLEDEKKSIFDEDYIGQCYIQYLNHYVDDCMTQKEISDVIGEKTVLLLAPGKSLKGTLDRINKIISEKDYYVISVNFVPAEIDVDMVFVSNNKRFSDENAYTKLIRKDLMVVITSNIRTDQANDMYVLNYSSYLNEEQCIADNAGLMCINFLKKIGIQNLILAGFDGFSVVQQDNYYEPDLLLNVEKERLMQINKAMRLKLKQLGKQINMDFLTESNYQ